MKKVFAYLILPILVIVLGYLVYNSVQEPVAFEKNRKAREAVAIQCLEDIRTLQEVFKTEHGRFTSSIDSLIDFYNNGQITIVRQIGSMDDSLAVAQNRVRRDSVKINVKDTLLKRSNFVASNLKVIPITEEVKVPVEMKAVIKQVSGVNVPLFEATVSYENLLAGLDHQLLVNLYHERVDTGRYPGLKVGSIDAPNNNAGNWE